MSTTVPRKRKSVKRRGTAALLPIDFALLEILPDEGQMLGFTPIALSVQSIMARPEFQGLSGNQISGRLKSMSYQGLTASQIILPIQRGLGWQRTAKGREALRKAGKEVVTGV